MSLIERLEKAEEENAALKKDLEELEEQKRLAENREEKYKRENEELRRQLAQLQTS